MKIDQFELEAFGKFTKQCFDFSHPQFGLHVIYGPNEAGKTTTQRALIQFLYGIPARSRDDFLHPKTKLRLRAVLSDSSGESYSFYRRKGASNTLLDGGLHPVDESLLKSLLGDLSESQYRTMFGLDQSRLMQGAQDLLSGGGELGMSLFEASTGLTGLHHLLSELREEAEAIYRERGEKYPLNRLLREEEKLRKACRDQTLSGKEWRELEQALHEAEEEGGELKKQRVSLDQKREKLTSLKYARPLMAEWKEVEEELRELEQVRRLPPSFSERRIQCVTQRKSLSQQVKAAKERIERVTGERLEVEKSRQAIAHEEELLDLFSRLSSYEEALEERDLLREKGEGERLELPLELVEKSWRQICEQDRELEREGRNEEEKSDGRELKRAQLRAQKKELERKTGGSVEQMVSWSLPSGLHVARIEQELEGVKAEKAECDANKKMLQKKKVQLEKKLQVLLREGRLPSQAAIQEVRKGRDQSWLSIKEALLEQEEACQRGRLEKEELAQGYVERVQQADALSDARWKEAERIAQFEQCGEELELLTKKEKQLAKENQNLEKKRAEILSLWESAWEKARLQGEGFEEQKRWLQDLKNWREQGELCLKEEELLEAQEQVARKQKGALTEKVERWSRDKHHLVAQLNLDLDSCVIEVEQKLQNQARFEEKRKREEACSGVITGFERRVEALWGNQRDHAAFIKKERKKLDAFNRLQAQVDQGQALEKREKEALDRLEVQLEECHGVWQELLREAEGESEEELAEKERLSEQKEGALKREQQLKAQLLQLSSGQTFQELQESVERVDLEQVEAELSLCLEHKEELDEKITFLDQQIGDLRKGMESMGAAARSGEAAKRASQRQQCRAQAGDLAWRYGRIQGAIVTLRATLEHYRKNHRGPLLERASELFQSMTRGSFIRLKTAFSHDDKWVVVGERPCGMEVEVEGMSRGTVEQLYLSLRMASIERYVCERQPIPVLLDDTLLDTDVDRAKEVIKGLGELSGKTQVLFFTHNRYFLEMAQEVISPDQLRVHPLGRE